MDEGAQTIPNFLRTYNPDIVGGSVGDHLSEVSSLTPATLEWPLQFPKVYA